MKQIDLSQWQKVGEGGNGSVYINPEMPDLILKIDKERINNLPNAAHEYNVSKNVESLGLTTPRMQEIVEIGNLYGTLQERIHGKKSLSRICSEDPSSTEKMARVLCEEGRKLFSTPCPTDRFHSRKEQLLGVVDKARFLTRKEREMVRGFAYSIPESDTCIHGDFQMGNLVQAGDKYYWIDLDRFAHGDPMFDIGHLYMICYIYAPIKMVQDIFHLTEDQFHRFWDAFATAYSGKEDHRALDAKAGKFALLDLVVRINFQRPNFLENIFFRLNARKLIKRFFR
ncbi:MAG: TIGR02172 family protein [Bacteroidales bacterium]|nr:TIGR02172 family protein [Bacteroidales bacterium]